MNVVDSSAWLEYFDDGRGAEQFANVIQDVEKLLVPTVAIYEVFKYMLRQRGESEALQAIGVMMLGEVVELTSTLSLNAAKLSYELQIPMADSIILATTRLHNATLWTQDRDFEGLENVNYFEKLTGDSDD